MPRALAPRGSPRRRPLARRGRPRRPPLQTRLQVPALAHSSARSARSTRPAAVRPCGSRRQRQAPLQLTVSAAASGPPCLLAPPRRHRRRRQHCHRAAGHLDRTRRRRRARLAAVPAVIRVLPLLRQRPPRRRGFGAQLAMRVRPRPFFRSIAARCTWGAGLHLRVASTCRLLRLRVRLWQRLARPRRQPPHLARRPAACPIAWHHVLRPQANTAATREAQQPRRTAA